MTVTLATAAWPDVPSAPLVLVPVGSTEQHGPHLPFDTDTRIASAVARELADRLSAGAGAGAKADAAGGPDAAARAVVLAPAIAYGASGEHQAFAGTASIGHEALKLVLIELVRSLSTFASRIVFVNGHGGNGDSLSAAVPRLIVEGHHVGWIPCSAGTVDAHAGRTETSLLLHLAPETVALERAVAGAVAPSQELMPALRAGGVASVSPSGVLGDPAGANAGEGAAVLEAMVASAVRRVTGWVVDARGYLVEVAPGRPS